MHAQPPAEHLAIVYTSCCDGQVYRWAGATYEGGVRYGLRDGAGTMAFADSPAVYEGQWRRGLRHGRGTLWYNPQRTAYYEGAARAAGWPVACTGWRLLRLWAALCPFASGQRHVRRLRERARACSSNRWQLCQQPC